MQKNSILEGVEGVLDMPLLQNKAGVRCAERTLDALREI